MRRRRDLVASVAVALHQTPATVRTMSLGDFDDVVRALTKEGGAGAG